MACQGLRRHDLHHVCLLYPVIVTPCHIVFSHGQESGPWGHKITALAEVVRAQGHEAHSVDYRGIRDPRERAARLVQFCSTLTGELVLAGSSVGAYVSVAAAREVQPRALFLMAPALYLHGLPPLPGAPLGCPVTVVHGWRDEIVPFSDSVRFAERERADLHLLESDHLLHDQMPVIRSLFGHFLATLDRPVPVEAQS